MKVIIVGCGKVGYTIAKSLAAEKDVDVTVIDIKANVFYNAVDSIDVMFLKGNGLSEHTLTEAGAKEADLLISVTNADETNILCCISAKRLGAKRTIARVRDPEYALNQSKLWKELGIDTIVNPEMKAAQEISKLLRFPAADDIETFAGGRVELVSLKVSEAPHIFVGKTVEQIFSKSKVRILLATVERGNTALIPHGGLVLEENDIIRILGRPSDIMDFFTFIGKKHQKIQDIMIIGGSKITHYLVNLLNKHNFNTKIKIIEIDKEKCEALSDSLSVNYRNCIIIHGDGTDEDVLSEESIDRTGAIVCLTDRDEENIVISLYSLQVGVKKVIAKVNHINQNMIKNLVLGSIVCPKNITSNHILRYVRGLTNATGNNIITMYNIFDSPGDRIEALEFHVGAMSKCINTPIKDLKLKKGILIGCIIRNTNTIIPSGESSMQSGDSVIIISKNDNILELDDILTNKMDVLMGKTKTE